MTLIVERLDRLAREYVVQEQLLIYLASKGIVLLNASTGENITEAINSDRMKKAIIQIQGVKTLRGGDWSPQLVRAFHKSSTTAKSRRGV